MCCNCFNRREFLGVSAAVAAGAALGAAGRAQAQGFEWAPDMWDPDRPFLVIGKALRVQPVLMYNLPTKRPMRSYKSWGGIQTEQAVAEEIARIEGELKDLAARAEFPVEVLPVFRVNSAELAEKARALDADATVIYPSTGSGKWLQAIVPERGATIFVRHKSGPVYYFYESLNVRMLKCDKDPADSAKRISVHDVVVDETNELLWRLRALYGVHNFLGSKVVALGGAGGKYDGTAPQFARDTYKLDIIETGYEDLAKRIESTLADPARMRCAEQWAATYLSLPGTTLETDRPFVVNAFALYGIFREIMAEHGASQFTISECMSTILPMSKTTACLTLSLLNDEGYGAFCEGDFVIVPAGMLLRHISGKPVFMHNSTFPHGGVVTCAHCTSPRRMDGKRYEPTRVLTHYESDFGAAPKVEFPVGQQVSFINPEYASGRWVGLKGTVESNPFYEICRSQQDVRVEGNWKKLLHEARDSHWMMTYGDYLKEVGHAAPRIGITWEDISEA